MLPPVRHCRAIGLLAFAPLLVFGCAGELENPERFSAPSVSRCTIDIDVQTEIFGTPEAPAKCGLGGCHGPAGGAVPPASELDLVSPGVEARLVGVAGVCMGLLIDPADPENSLMVRKLHPAPSCGQRMPFGGMLTDDEIDCVTEWVTQAAMTGAVDAGAGSGSDAGGGDDAGAADVDGGM